MKRLSSRQQRGLTHYADTIGMDGQSQARVSRSAVAMPTVGLCWRAAGCAAYQTARSQAVLDCIAAVGARRTRSQIGCAALEGHVDRRAPQATLASGANTEARRRGLAPAPDEHHQGHKDHSCCMRRILHDAAQLVIHAAVITLFETPSSTSALFR